MSALSGLSERSMNESMGSTLRRGLALSPEFRRGLLGTLLLALVATAGKVVVPVAVQQTMDSGLGGPHGPDLGYVRTAVIICAAAVLVTAVASYLMNVRLYVSSEAGLAALRTRAFRHVHDLSVLTQNNSGAARWSPGSPPTSTRSARSCSPAASSSWSAPGSCWSRWC